MERSPAGQRAVWCMRGRERVVVTEGNRNRQEPGETADRVRVLERMRRMPVDRGKTLRATTQDAPQCPRRCKQELGILHRARNNKRVKRVLNRKEAAARRCTGDGVVTHIDPFGSALEEGGEPENSSKTLRATTQDATQDPRRRCEAPGRHRARKGKRIKRAVNRSGSEGVGDGRVMAGA